MSVDGVAGACRQGMRSRISNSFIGKSTNASTSIYGVRSQIENNAINLCGSNQSSSDGGVSAWSMLSAATVGNSSRINFAQVGYSKTGGLSAYGAHDKVVFSFFTKKCYAEGTCSGNNAFEVTFTNDAPPSGSNFYAVYLNAGNDRIRMVQNGQVIDELGYDVTGLWRSDWFGQYFGETFDRGDDVMGDAQDKTDFAFLQWYNSSGGINFFASGDLNPGSSGAPRYHRENFTPSGGGQGFRVWTDPL